MYQITKMPGDPDVQSDKLCRVSVISHSVMFSMLQ